MSSEDQEQESDKQQQKELGKVVAKLKIQWWANDVLVAESPDEKLWVETLERIPLVNELKQQKDGLKELHELLRSEIKNHEKKTKAKK